MGRKRTRNPETWTRKFVKGPGLRKNSPLLLISEDTTCCKKKSKKIRESSPGKAKGWIPKAILWWAKRILVLPPTQLENQKSSGYLCKKKPSITASGKKNDRPAETSKFSFKYTLCDEHNVNVCVCQKGFCHVLGFGPERIQVMRRKLNAHSARPVWQAQ